MKMFQRKPIRHRMQKFWTSSVVFHGSPCPLLALGVRVCDTALEKLNLNAPEAGRLVCVSEYDGCYTDAIQVCLHCTAGRKHLLYYKTGRLIFTVYDLNSDASVRICAKSEIEETIRERQVSDILVLPEYRLFDFEDAHPLSARTLEKVRRTCYSPIEGIPHRDSGVQDCPDQFLKFDLPDDGIRRIAKRRF